MADIKATEIVGELKKHARLFDIFQEAANIAGFFADLEQKQTKLERLIADLEGEKAKLDKSIDEQVKAANDKLAKLEEKAKEAEEAEKQARERASFIVERAQKDGVLLLKNAEKQVADIKAAVAGLYQEQKKAQEAAEAAQAKHEKMLAEMQAKRDELLKAFS